jgi:hypothetical protein
MINPLGNVEKIKGMVSCIYEDFDTSESIIKDRAVAFGLNIIDDKGNDRNKGKEEKVIVVYDRNAFKLGLIKVGEPLTCFGNYSGRIAAVDSNGNVVEEKMFTCIGIMGSTDINEEQLIKKGAVRLR